MKLHFLTLSALAVLLQLFGAAPSVEDPSDEYFKNFNNEKVSF